MALKQSTVRVRKREREREKERERERVVEANQCGNRDWRPLCSYLMSLRIWKSLRSSPSLRINHTLLGQDLPDGNREKTGMPPQLTWRRYSEWHFDGSMVRLQIRRKIIWQRSISIHGNTNEWIMPISGSIYLRRCVRRWALCDVEYEHFGLRVFECVTLSQ